ncbi:MAG: glycosyltransferase family 1 protein, partial [Planctomycetota bacterium]
FNVAGVRDSVEDGVSGHLAENQNGFVAQWIALASDAGRRMEMSAAARARAASFTWDRAVDSFESVLERNVRVR